MCECLGCSGCRESRKGLLVGKCNWPLGKYQHQKRAKRCHWCFEHIDADTEALPSHLVYALDGEAPVPSVATGVASTEVTTWAPTVTSARPSTPLTVRLLTDSVGRLKSKGKDYIHEVQTHVASQDHVIIVEKEIFIAGDLPEVAAYFDRCSGPADLNLIILMSNYAANTLGQVGISDLMRRACRRVQEVAESVPTYVIYGGPGEMWRHVVRCGGQQNCFETKAKQIRELLASSGHVKVQNGKSDFRAFFTDSDLDDIGHIKGVAREKAIQWMAKQVMDASHDLRLMQPSAAAWLGAGDPLATKRALIGFPPLAQVAIPAEWLPRTLSQLRPHVFLLSGPDEKCAAQQNAASDMFLRLGWEPKLVDGIGREVKLPHPRSHWAWACAFLPKLLQIIAASNCSDDEVVLLGEDSCWPTTSCTPQQVRFWMEDALRQGYQGMWIGACGANRKRTFSMRVNSHGQQEDQACTVTAPCGSKLFAVTIRQLRLMAQVWGWVPQHWFVDGVNHLLAASGQLMVRDTFLAGSMQHFSMRCGKVCEAHLNINFLGTLLPEGRSVEHCVQTDLSGYRNRNRSFVQSM